MLETLAVWLQIFAIYSDFAASQTPYQVCKNSDPLTNDKNVCSLDIFLIQLTFTIQFIPIVKVSCLTMEFLPVPIRYFVLVAIVIMKAVHFKVTTPVIFILDFTLRYHPIIFIKFLYEPNFKI